MHVLFEVPVTVREQRPRAPRNEYDWPNWGNYAAWPLGPGTAARRLALLLAELGGTAWREGETRDRMQLKGGSSGCRRVKEPGCAEDAVLWPRWGNLRCPGGVMLLNLCWEGCESIPEKKEPKQTVPRSSNKCGGCFLATWGGHNSKNGVWHPWLSSQCQNHIKGRSWFENIDCLVLVCPSWPKEIRWKYAMWRNCSSTVLWPTVRHS